MCDAVAIKEGKTRERLRKYLKYIVSLIMVFVIVLNMTLPAKAYTSVYIQTSIDLSSWEILSSVVSNEVGLTSVSPEFRRIAPDDLKYMRENGGTWGSIRGNLINTDALKTAVTERENKVANKGNIISGLVGNLVDSEDNRVLTFPTKQNKRNDSTAIDHENAMEANGIIYDLNQAFYVYCENKNINKTEDASKFLEEMIRFLGSSELSVSGDNVIYDGVEYRWKIKKECSYPSSSSEYITWEMLVFEAFYNYSLESEEAVTSENVYSSTPNQLTKAIVGVVGSALDSLRGLLGLWSMDELLFNAGWRGSGYVGGIFPQSWESYVWTFLLFSEIIAVMILLAGVVNQIVKKAMSTMNTVERIQIWKQVQDLIVCAIALTLLPLVLRMLITISADLTLMIRAIVPDGKKVSDMVTRFVSGSGTIGGLIGQCLYFGIQVYINFLYALRSYTVSALIIIAPIMISLIIVSDSKKQSTVMWAKELLAQVLVQPIQAFFITIVLLLPTSSHGFDNLIALYALIPFTNVIKSLFFGSSGSWSDQIAGKAKDTATGTLKAAVVGAGGALLGGAFNSNHSEKGERAEHLNSDSNQNHSIENQDLDGRGTGTSEKNTDENENHGRGKNTLFHTMRHPIQTMQESDYGAVRSFGNGLTGTANPRFSESLKNAQGLKEKASVVGNQVASLAGNTARVGAGMALGALGGAMRSNHLGGVALEDKARSLIAGRNLSGRRSEDTSSAQEEKEEEKIPETNREETTSHDNAFANSMKYHGADASGKDILRGQTDALGIRDDLFDDRRDLSMAFDKDSEIGQQAGAYADRLNAMTPEERRKVTDETGVNAVRDGDDVRVNVDKKKWSKDNDGAVLGLRRNSADGKQYLEMKKPHDAEIPSVTPSMERVDKIVSQTPSNEHEKHKNNTKNPESHKPKKTKNPKSPTNSHGESAEEPEIPTVIPSPVSGTNGQNKPENHAKNAEKDGAKSHEVYDPDSENKSGNKNSEPKTEPREPVSAREMFASGKSSDDGTILTLPNAESGIDDLRDNGNELKFAVSGNSDFARGMKSYADRLDALPEDERKKEVNRTGIDASYDPDDGVVRTNVDKNKWSMANNGAQIGVSNDGQNLTMNHNAEIPSVTPTRENTHHEAQDGEKYKNENHKKQTPDSVEPAKDTEPPTTSTEKTAMNKTSESTSGHDYSENGSATPKDSQGIVVEKDGEKQAPIVSAPTITVPPVVQQETASTAKSATEHNPDGKNSVPRREPPVFTSAEGREKWSASSAIHEPQSLTPLTENLDAPPQSTPIPPQPMGDVSRDGDVPNMDRDFYDYYDYDKESGSSTAQSAYVPTVLPTDVDDRQPASTYSAETNDTGYDIPQRQGSSETYIPPVSSNDLDVGGDSVSVPPAEPATVSEPSAFESADVAPRQGAEIYGSHIPATAYSNTNEVQRNRAQQASPDVSTSTFAPADRSEGSSMESVSMTSSEMPKSPQRQNDAPMQSSEQTVAPTQTPAFIADNIPQSEQTYRQEPSEVPPPAPAPSPTPTPSPAPADNPTSGNAPVADVVPIPQTPPQSEAVQNHSGESTPPLNTTARRLATSPISSGEPSVTESSGFSESTPISPPIRNRTSSIQTPTIQSDNPPQPTPQIQQTQQVQPTQQTTPQFSSPQSSPSTVKESAPRSDGKTRTSRPAQTTAQTIGTGQRQTGEHRPAFGMDNIGSAESAGLGSTHPYNMSGMGEGHGTPTANTELGSAGSRTNPLDVDLGGSPNHPI